MPLERPERPNDAGETPNGTALAAEGIAELTHSNNAIDQMTSTSLSAAEQQLAPMQLMTQETKDNQIRNLMIGASTKRRIQEGK
ncbi:MAG: hypothetical protein K2X77_27775 [Candidatus Obscuribacterales bacterium]|nr:hypothetical protein [Candidatus Obscuribacterales bacterium]